MFRLWFHVTHIFRNSFRFLSLTMTLRAVFLITKLSLSVFVSHQIFFQLLIMSQSMRKPILTKFLCCFDLRTGGLFFGLTDCLIYGALILVSSLHLFFNIEFLDKKHGETFLLEILFLCWPQLRFLPSLWVQRTFPTGLSLRVVHNFGSFSCRTKGRISEESLSILDPSGLSSVRLPVHRILHSFLLSYNISCLEALLLRMCLFYSPTA